MSHGRHDLAFGNTHLRFQSHVADDGLASFSLLWPDEQRRKRVRPPEIGGAVVDQAPVADDETDNLLRKVLVTQALAALSPAHREVLNETILRDRTVNQAAEVLGVPVGTVKSRVYYALKALRVVMAERGVTA